MNNQMYFLPYDYVGNNCVHSCILINKVEIVGMRSMYEAIIDPRLEYLDGKYLSNVLLMTRHYKYNLMTVTLPIRRLLTIWPIHVYVIAPKIYGNYSPLLWATLYLNKEKAEQDCKELVDKLK